MEKIEGRKRCETLQKFKMAIKQDEVEKVPRDQEYKVQKQGLKGLRNQYLHLDTCAADKHLII